MFFAICSNSLYDLISKAEGVNCTTKEELLELHISNIPISDIVVEWSKIQ